ncbi:hypothetical protein [Sphingomonas carotinifaciens]|uniref:hypothetical protein n=1 Tax=Sphingomonas carotinifaciens TaxID=1166323 RepID=UPI000DD6EC39|nr:hypothetical protein [Sphingomonas carotinifaciens]
MLADCPGLIDLMLTGDEHRTSFGLNGVGVSVERIGDAAYLEAACPEFRFLAIYPGWYAGEHDAPAYVVLVGNPIACTQWLPMEQDDRLAIINRLPLHPIDRTLCRLAAYRQRA